MPHRFFVPPGSIRGHVLTLAPAQARQVHQVLKLEAGEEVIALDRAGYEHRVRLTDVSRETVRGEILARSLAGGEPRATIILYQSLLKADKFEWVLQKCTEVGVAQFVPVVSERCVADRASEHKLTRWEQIIQEAAEQARRGKLPRLGRVIPFSEALVLAAATPSAGRATWICYEEERALDLRGALEAQTDLLRAAAPEVHLFVGPEGGFSPGEVEQARSHGVLSVTLGPRILRAETAGLVAAGALLFALGDMRQP